MDGWSGSHTSMHLVLRRKRTSRYLDRFRDFVRPGLPAPGRWDLINYYGPPATLPSISLARLLDDGEEVPSEYFRDRVVFIGSQAVPELARGGSGEGLVPYPSLCEWMFGVEIHSTIAANLLDGTWLEATF